LAQTLIITSPNIQMTNHPQRAHITHFCTRKSWLSKKLPRQADCP